MFLIMVAEFDTRGQLLLLLLCDRLIRRDNERTHGDTDNTGLGKNYRVPLLDCKARACARYIVFADQNLSACVIIII